MVKSALKSNYVIIQYIVMENYLVQLIKSNNKECNIFIWSGLSGNIIWKSPDINNNLCVSNVKIGLLYDNILIFMISNLILILLN